MCSTLRDMYDFGQYTSWLVCILDLDLIHSSFWKRKDVCLPTSSTRHMRVTMFFGFRFGSDDHVSRSFEVVGAKRRVGKV